MARVRELVLRRARESAKVMPMEKVRGAIEPLPELAEPKAKEIAIQCDDSFLPPQLRVPTPVARRHAPAKASEQRRPGGLGGPGGPVAGADGGRAGAVRGGRAGRGMGAGRSAAAGEDGAPGARRQEASAPASVANGAPSPSAASVVTSAPASAPPEAASESPARRRRPPGRVPQYLLRRKEELADARRQAALPPAPVPPAGYRRVGDEEKSSAIEALRRRRDEVDKALRALPFKIETVGQRQREKDITGRLSHIERLLTMFQQPVVFVPADSEPIGGVGPEGIAA
eukprot:TRINITY_DN19377_c0_g2_i1.p1 TRINITY_DN19377_c0_g2~~TRINITY_DN19377_c0_g2_i1.p1  ORF type:complete len:322 (+),score=62.32 TRINITY_DN19377_c0_g2_i1:109-966(+)